MKVYFDGKVITEESVERVKPCKHEGYGSDNYMKRPESWHLPEICSHSKLGTMIQLAYIRGASEISVEAELNEENAHAIAVARRSCPVRILIERSDDG